jgi:Divergent InlB B-repeat domain
MRIKNYLKLGIICLFVVVLLIAAQGIAFSASSYTITVSCGAGGKLTPAGPSVIVYRGGSQNFTIQANSGYRIADVLVDGVSIGPVTSYRFRKVRANHTIAASFVALATYTITATAGAGGSINPSGTITVTAGSSKAFSITANTGYKIGAVTVDGSSKGALGSYTFTNITANHSIAASFAAIPVYTINASAGTGGSINPSGTINVNQGSSKTFSIRPTAVIRLAP